VRRICPIIDHILSLSHIYILNHLKKSHHVIYIHKCPLQIALRIGLQRLMNHKIKILLPVSARWSNLSPEEEERTQSSPRNTFQQRRNNFGPDKDKHGNYRKSTFRRETRPKTPPPPTFDFKEDDFPSLG